MLNSFIPPESSASIQRRLAILDAIGSLLLMSSLRAVCIASGSEDKKPSLSLKNSATPFLVVIINTTFILFVFDGKWNSAPRSGDAEFVSPMNYFHDGTPRAQ